MDIAAEIPTAVPGNEEHSVRSERINPEMFARNLTAFARAAPGLHERLARISKTQSTLIANPKSGYDIEYGGTRLYGGNHRAVARRRVADFFKTPQEKTRIRLSPPDSSRLDAHANKRIYRLMKRASQDYGITFAEKRTTTDCFHLIVLGIGLAEHILPLVKRTNCRLLILAEPNIEFLYHSLHTFDWARFFAAYLTRGRAIHFVTDVTPQLISTTIRGLVRFSNAPAVDGTYVHVAYRGSFLEAVALDLSKNRDLLLTGLGFLQDECDMVRNAYGNLVDYNGKFMGRHENRLPVPAFVIASGPSIDNNLDFLRANADRALIVSCGTSLRILLNNGIRPDFHMEMENIPAVYDLISKWSEIHSLKGITLVASTTIDPRIRFLFDQTIFYTRPGIASWPMFTFGEGTHIPHAGPLVANLGLSFSQQAGARTIYFFGVDCGARDPKRHHGKDAPYNAGEIEFTTTIDRPVPGNFGGTVYSEFVYLWSRDDLHVAIRNHSPGVIHYNCSDGVLVEGATPKLSRTIALPAADKAPIVAKLLDAYKDYPREQFEKSWTKRNLVRAALEFRDRLRDGLEHPPETKGSLKPGPARKDPLFFLFQTVKNLIPTREGENSPEHHYFRGSTFLAGIGMYFYEGRVKNPRQRAVFRRLMKEELSGLFGDIADYVIDFYRGLDPDKIERDEKEAADLLKSKFKTKTGKTPRKSPKIRRRDKNRPQAKKGSVRAVKSRRKGKRRPIRKRRLSN